ncbi:MAG TPA: hypothetical protein PLW65_09020 [Pseudomonadota bacterium]|nr:hypothetical protein [Pseudomonadota bacterium]
MERREFFQAGALGAIALLGRGGAAQAAQELSPTAMEQFLGRLDRQQEWMARHPVDGILAAVGATQMAERERCEALIRKVLRSMNLTRSFRELPASGRAHPGMQGRLAAALPEITAAVAEARSFLIDLSPADRIDLQRTVRGHPELLPRLAAHLEEEALAAGIAPERGEQVRRQVEHLDLQLRRSQAGVVLDEYVARADRAAQAGSVKEMLQRLGDRLSAPAFYTQQQRQQELARAWWEQPAPAEYPGDGEIYRLGDESPSQEDRERRVSKLVTGAVLLGIGFEWTAFGLGFIPLTVGLSAIAATPGVPMLIAGIALLSVYGRRPG